MNLYFRLMIMLVKCLFVPKQKILEESRISFRVMLTDCDLNRHMTNSRYLSFMDLGRFYLMAQLRILGKVLKGKWAPILTGAEITFIRALNPLQKFDLITRILTWDEKYYYFEQRFEVNGELYALALAKGVFIAKKEKVPMSAIMAATSDYHNIAPSNEIILHWKNMAETKKSINQKNPN